jgi:hypothetical protein
MLGTLEPEQKRNWNKYLQPLVFAYNAMKHESTGFSPFELMFGRKPRLAIDNMFHIDNESFISIDYVKDLKSRMEFAQNIANKNLADARLKQKMNYNKKAKAALLQVGDKVLVKK